MKKLLSLALLLIFMFAMLLPASAAEAATPTGIPLSEIEDRIDALMERYMNRFTAGAAVAIVHEGELIFSRGYGTAEYGQQTPIDPAATLFEWGSINKLFIYTAAMQLVEQGLIDLDNNVDVYLPEDLMRAFSFEYSFTVRDLMHHSAGFGESIIDMALVADNLESRQTTLRQGLLATQPVQIYEPGTASSYSNFGSALLAYVIENVSGIEFSAFERTNILDPLGMVNTRNQPDWIGASGFLQSRARGHWPASGGGFQHANWIYLSIYPAGAIIGTAEDLAQFAIALMPPEDEAGPLFASRSTLDLMLSASSDTLLGMYHGFIGYDGVYPAIGHGGGTAGFNAEFALVPSQRFGVVVTTNTRGGMELTSKILDLLIGDSRDTVPPSPANLPDAASVEGVFTGLRRHEGTFLESIDPLLTSPLTITALDANTITYSFHFGGNVATLTFRQIAPYVFRVVETDGSTIANSMARQTQEIRFIMEDGRPVRIDAYGPGGYTPQTFGQTMLSFLLGLALSIVCMLFFVIMSIIVFIKFLRKRKTNRFHLLSSGLLVCGLLFTINALLFELTTIPAMNTMSLLSSQIMPHIWMNYVILALTVATLVTSLIFFVKDKENITKKRKVFYFFNIAFITLFVLNMWSWNYFMMV